MASNGPPPPPANPLSIMTALSPSVSIYQPTTAAATTTTTTTTTTTSPKLIILATWMGARDAHIAKYLLPYTSLYPTSAILLLRSSLRDFLFPRSGTSTLAAAVPYIQTIFPPSSSSQTSTTTTTTTTTNPELHIHVFSNGGSLTLHTLTTLLLHSPSSSSFKFPSHTLVFDSAPSQYSYARSLIAVAAPLTPTQRLVFAPLVHLLCTYLMLLNLAAGDGFAKVAAAHNDTAGRAGSEVRRTYVYSEEDALVDFRDVEQHAEEARGRGLRVKLVKVVGTAHVAHARGEEGGRRYWEVVKACWRGGDFDS
ncbi:hypothetical protein B0T19DRAFT_429601 [Cercophora scortea]|uniref:Indole-diterpene biosynthesis protein PaxU n=1 Tax=Cercophora scortea TaxID=314031 RepID=A0AAE0I8F5_9PEZI|nr:hypothetical protein B0T19DRAFT_429601 [Cercophora scortea]